MAPAERLEDYRALSAAAVGALLIGLLGLLGFLTPLLWFLPLIGVGLALKALHTMKQDESLTGRKAALLGLLISIFVLGAAPARHFSRRAALFAQARAHADAWLKLVQENRQIDAFELTQRYPDRQPKGADVEEYYAREPDMKMENQSPQQVKYPGRDLFIFFRPEILKALTEQGSDVEIRFLGNEQLFTRDGGDRVVVLLAYEATFTDAEGERVTKPFRMRMERLKYGDIGEAHWRVMEMDVTNKFL